MMTPCVTRTSLPPSQTVAPEKVSFGLDVRPQQDTQVDALSLTKERLHPMSSVLCHGYKSPRIQDSGGFHPLQLFSPVDHDPPPTTRVIKRRLNSTNDQPSHDYVGPPCPTRLSNYGNTLPSPMDASVRHEPYYQTLLRRGRQDDDVCYLGSSQCRLQRRIGQPSHFAEVHSILPGMLKRPGRKRLSLMLLMLQPRRSLTKGQKTRKKKTPRRGVTTSMLDNIGSVERERERVM